MVVPVIAWAEDPPITAPSIVPPLISADVIVAAVEVRLVTVPLVIVPVVVVSEDGLVPSSTTVPAEFFVNSRLSAVLTANSAPLEL
jgi:hypothetical protein